MCLGPFCSWLGKMKLLHSFGGNLIDGPCSPWLSMTVHLVSHFDEMLLPISRCVWSCMRLSDIAGPVFRTFCYKPTVHNAPLNKKEVTGLHEEFLTLQCSLRESCTSLNCIPIISSHTHVHPHPSCGALVFEGDETAHLHPWCRCICPVFLGPELSRRANGQGAARSGAPDEFIDVLLLVSFPHGNLKNGYGIWTSSISCDDQRCWI